MKRITFTLLILGVFAVSCLAQMGQPTGWNETGPMGPMGQMGSGMMGPGGPGMMGPEMGQGPMWFQYLRYPECSQFLDNTTGDRRKLLLMRFDYFEAMRKPETAGNALSLEQEIRDLSDFIYQQAPSTCRGGGW